MWILNFITDKAHTINQWTSVKKYINYGNSVENLEYSTQFFRSQLWPLYHKPLT